MPTVDKIINNLGQKQLALSKAVRFTVMYRKTQEPVCVVDTRMPRDTFSQPIDWDVVFKEKIVHKVHVYKKEGEIPKIDLEDYLKLDWYIL